MIITDGSQLFVMDYMYMISHTTQFILHAQGQNYAFLQQLPAGLPKITI